MFSNRLEFFQNYKQRFDFELFCITFYFINYTFRDVAQSGSAFVWGARGRWFKSSHPDSFYKKIGRNFKRINLEQN